MSITQNDDHQNSTRLLRLFRYLENAQDGVTRQEVYNAVPEYQDIISESAQGRAFERDIERIEAAGFQVEHKRTRGPAKYRVTN